MTEANSYSAAVARRVAKVSQRCLDHWNEIGLVRPSGTDAVGKGSERRYTFQDLVRLTVVSRLRETGLSLQRIAKGIKVLRRDGRSADPLLGQVLFAQGKSLFVRINEKTLEDVLSGGQMVFSVIAVGRVAQHARKRVDALLEKGVRGRFGLVHSARARNRR